MRYSADYADNIGHGADARVVSVYDVTTGTYTKETVGVMGSSLVSVNGLTDTGTKHMTGTVDMRDAGVEHGRFAVQFQLQLPATACNECGAGGFPIFQLGGGGNGTVTLQYVPVIGGTSLPHMLVARVTGDIKRVCTVTPGTAGVFMTVFLEYNGSDLLLVCGDSSDSQSSATVLAPTLSPQPILFGADIASMSFYNLVIYNNTLIPTSGVTPTQFPYMLWDNSDSGVVAVYPVTYAPSTIFNFVDQGFTPGHKAAEMNINTASTIVSASLVVNEQVVAIPGFVGTTAANLADWLINNNGGVISFPFDGKTENIHLTTNVQSFNNFSVSGLLTGWYVISDAHTGIPTNTITTGVLKGAGNVTVDRITTDGNYAYGSDKIFVSANDVIEASLSIKVNTNLTPGTRYFGLLAFDAADNQLVIDRYNTADHLFNSSSNNQYWYASNPAALNTWVDIVGYVIGANVNAATLPIPNNMNTGSFFKLPANTAYIRLRYLNDYNAGTSCQTDFYMGGIRNYNIKAEHRRGSIDGQMSFAVRMSGLTTGSVPIVGSDWDRTKAILGKIPQQFYLPHTGMLNSGISIMGSTKSVTSPKTLKLARQDTAVRTIGKVIGSVTNRPTSLSVLQVLPPVPFLGAMQAPYPDKGVIWGTTGSVGTDLPADTSYAYGITYSRFMEADPVKVGMARGPNFRSKVGDFFAAFSLDIPYGKLLRGVDINFVGMPPGLIGNSVTTYDQQYEWGIGQQQFPMALTGGSDYTVIYTLMIAVDPEGIMWRPIPSLGTDAVKVSGSSTWKSVVFKSIDYQTLLDISGNPLLRGSRRVHLRFALANELSAVTYNGLSYFMDRTTKK